MADAGSVQGTFGTIVLGLGVQRGTGKQYAQRWVQPHQLQKNVPAMEMVSIMDAIDDMVFGTLRGFLNQISTEKLVRRAYGLEKAFENVHREEDWRRPDGKTSWSTKVKWGLCDRYDLRGHGLKPTSISHVDEEARRSMERDAAFYKYYDKVKGHTASKED